MIDSRDVKYFKLLYSCTVQYLAMDAVVNGGWASFTLLFAVLASKAVAASKTIAASKVDATSNVHQVPPVPELRAERPCDGEGWVKNHEIVLWTSYTHHQPTCACTTYIHTAKDVKHLQLEN